MRDTRARLSEINAKILLAVNLEALQGIGNRVAKCHHLWGKKKRCLIAQSTSENLPIKTEGKTVASYPQQDPFLEGSCY